MGLKEALALAETSLKQSTKTQLTTLVSMTTTLSVQEKIEKIVTEIYRGSKVNFEKKAQTQIAQIVQNGWDKLPICMG